MAKRGPKGLGPTSKNAFAVQRLLQQGVELMNAGRPLEAELCAKEILGLEPRNGAALNLLGNVALNNGRCDEAAGFLKRAVKDQPKNPFLHFNLGEALRRGQSFARAATAYQAAVKLKPDFGEAYAQLGEVRRSLSQWKQAREAYRRALAIKPDLPVALNGYGVVLQREGDEAQAAECFEAALKSAPATSADATAGVWANLGLARYRLGAVAPALEAMIEAVTRAPGNDDFWRLLAISLNNLAVVPEDPRFRDILLQLFERDDVNPRTLASVAVLTVLREPGIRRLVDAIAKAPTQAEGVVAGHGEDVRTLIESELFLALLVNAPVPHAGLELALTEIRRAILLGADGSDASLRFVCALARQCFLNEYVYFTTEEETVAVAKLSGVLRRDPVGGDEGDWQRLAIVACYEPLHRTRAAEMDLSGAPEPCRDLIREQITEPARERALAASLERLKPIEDEVSLAVQTQYEENPYPRWTRAQIAEPLPFAEAVRARVPFVDERLIPQPDAPRILIAGSGTGLATTRVVNAFKNAQILAVDLSAASLAYDERKLAERGITSVRHLQADILDLETLGERFDLVESFGVIHHMREPEEGLRVLSSLLKPGGILLVGLYSSIARSSVVAARELIAARGYPQTPDGIRAARREIMIGEGNAPELEALLSPASDFWTTSDCRDLIFHVEEHRFTLPEIEDMLARMDLQFLGIETGTPSDTRRFVAENPDPAALSSLAAWHAFETRHPETFGDTYRIWARRRPGR
jgi:tetratricopeptide (TPR) repeat protein/SAM-dependent methyltransferase